jgi:hypothetical protein
MGLSVSCGSECASNTNDASCPRGELRIVLSTTEFLIDLIVNAATLLFHKRQKLSNNLWQVIVSTTKE